MIFWFGRPASDGMAASRYSSSLGIGSAPPPAVGCTRLQEARDQNNSKHHQHRLRHRVGLSLLSARKSETDRATIASSNKQTQFTSVVTR